MISCPDCNKNFKDGVKFCTVCGKNLLELKKLAEDREAQRIEKESRIGYKVLSFVKQMPRKVWLMAGVGAAALVVLTLIAGAIVSFLNQPSPDKYVVYLKENELYLSMQNMQGGFPITDGLSDHTSSAGELEIAGISSDGSKVIYSPEIYYAQVFDLCYRSTDKDSDEEVIIAENVRDFWICPNAEYLIYMTAEGLYFYDYAESEQIGEKVRECYVSQDCRIIYFTTTNNAVCCWEYGEELTVLTEDNGEIDYVSKDFSTVYFHLGNLLLVSRIGQEKVGIDTSAEYMQAFEDGTMYYTKSEVVTYNVSEFVKDDYLEADKELTHIAPPDYYLFDWPEKPVNPTEEEQLAYEEAYEKVYAEYCAQMESYKQNERLMIEKEQRDELRNEISKKTFSVNRNALYYYDGKTSVKVADDILPRDMLSDADCITGTYAATLFTYAYERTEIPTAKLSTIINLETKISEWRVLLQFGSLRTKLFVKDRGEWFEKSFTSDMVFSHDGSKAYVIKGSDNVLYEIDLNSENLEMVEYDTNVCSVRGCVIPLENGGLMYFKDVEVMPNNSGTLCINKREIETDVLCMPYEILDDGSMYFFKLGQRGMAKLCYYTEDDVVEIDDDVYTQQFAVSGENGIFYMKDYNTEKKRGDLYYSVNGQKGKLVDEKVSEIIAP